MVRRENLLKKDQMTNRSNYFIYMLLCDNGNYYTGYTAELARRYREHLDGSIKCKYTRSFQPVCIAQCWQVKNCKSTALKIEKYIKGLKKRDKELLISSPEKLIQLFDCKVYHEQ